MWYKHRMDIPTFLKQHTAANTRAIAAKAGTTLGYLRLIGYGIRRPSADMALRLEHASNGLLTARELRPDLPWPRYAPDRASETAMP